MPLWDFDVGRYVVVEIYCGCEFELGVYVAVKL